MVQLHMRWFSLVEDVYEMLVYVTDVHTRICNGCLWLEMYERLLSILQLFLYEMAVYVYNYIQDVVYATAVHI